MKGNAMFTQLPTKAPTKYKIARSAQVLCVGAAGLLPIIVIRKLPTFSLTETQLWLVGVAVVTVSLLFAVIAMLFEFLTKKA